MSKLFYLWYCLYPITAQSSLNVLRHAHSRSPAISRGGRREGKRKGEKGERQGREKGKGGRRREGEREGRERREGEKERRERCKIGRKGREGEREGREGRREGRREGISVREYAHSEAGDMVRDMVRKGKNRMRYDIRLRICMIHACVFNGIRLRICMIYACVFEWYTPAYWYLVAYV